MRYISTILLMSCLAVLANTQMLQAQSAASGKVIDAETGQPLEGANVYLSGTKIGAGASTTGQYSLENISPGGYRIVASRVGYKTIIKDLIIGSGETQTVNFKLKPVVYKLPEIYVGDYDEQWKKNLEQFTNNFIGETTWADSVKILNPRALRFDKNWWGRLEAEALAPLRIENKALGYRIIYNLEEFSHSGGRTRWDGEPLFQEMTPADSAQASYWGKNRQKAFNGSLRHFLLALLNDRVEEEGFMLYHRREEIRGRSSQNLSTTDGQRFLKEGDESYLHNLNFFGRLKVVYTKEEESEQYIQWVREYARARHSVQTSFLELNEHPITVDSDGEIIQPYGATQFGYYSYSRVADLTPRGYRPEGYSKSNK